jgi:endogenous inhibitor of DNA gyrase (YacG/DUF329 family)
MINVRCPICDQVMQGQTTAEWPQFPFCSPRCKTIDLGRWLGEGYRYTPERPPAETEEQSTEDEVP